MCIVLNGPGERGPLTEESGPGSGRASGRSGLGGAAGGFVGGFWVWGGGGRNARSHEEVFGGFG